MNRKSKIWVWGQGVNAYKVWDMPDCKTDIVEGANIFSARNIFLVADRPADLEKGTAGLAGFDRVVLAIWPQENFDYSGDIKAAGNLTQKYPNIEGVILDDLTSTEIATKGMKPHHLAKVRDEIKSGWPKLDLWGVMYSTNLDLPRLGEYLDCLDVMSFWTWDAKDLTGLESNFKRTEELAKGKPILQGIYMWDFAQKTPIPMALMKHQCSLAEEWLRAGRTAGVILLGTSCADAPLEAVDYGKCWAKEISQKSS